MDPICLNFISQRVFRFLHFFFQTKVDMKLGERRDQTILPPTVILGEHGRVIYIVGDVGLCG